MAGAVGTDHPASDAGTAVPEVAATDPAPDAPSDDAQADQAL